MWKQDIRKPARVVLSSWGGHIGDHLGEVMYGWTLRLSWVYLSWAYLSWAYLPWAYLSWAYLPGGNRGWTYKVFSPLPSGLPASINLAWNPEARMIPFGFWGRKGNLKGACQKILPYKPLMYTAIFYQSVTAVGQKNVRQVEQIHLCFFLLQCFSSFFVDIYSFMSFQSLLGGYIEMKDDFRRIYISKFMS